MNNFLFYDEAYSRIRQEVMDEEGYDDDDMDDDSIEDEVNREADARFIKMFGFEYSPIENDYDG